MKHSVYNTKGVSLTSGIREDLAILTKDYHPSKVFVIFEENTWLHCWPHVKDFRELPDDHFLILKAGEENKSIDQVMKMWEFLGERRADRKSLVINIGGGMLTDLAGFAASTFKRGISFINIPTTLLAMVDASVGGKTGFNFRHLKNEIGVIRQPLHVFLYLPFLLSLDDQNFKSGFAEMLKAGLIRSKDLWDKLIQYDLNLKSTDALAPLLWESVIIKNEVVELDPEEQGLRKALNFGHTIGHALESLSMTLNKAIPHGYAVAYGMMAEVQLSEKLLNLPVDQAEAINKNIQKIYGDFPAYLEIDDLINLMRFDKKNEGNQINFTLLSETGTCHVNNYVPENQIIDLISPLISS